MKPTQIKSEALGRSPRKRRHKQIKAEAVSSHPPFTFSSVFQSTSQQPPQSSTSNASTFPQRLLTDFFSPTSRRNAQLLSKTEACPEPDSLEPSSSTASLLFLNGHTKVELPFSKTEALSQTEEQNPTEELPIASIDVVSPISISNLECEEIEVIDLTHSPDNCQRTDLSHQLSPKIELLTEEVSSSPNCIYEEIPQDPFPHSSISVQDASTSTIHQEEETSTSTNKDRMYKRRRSSRLTENYNENSSKVGTYYQYVVEVKKEPDEDDLFAEFKRKKRPRKDCPYCGEFDKALVWPGMCQKCNLDEKFDRTKTRKPYERRKEAEKAAQLAFQAHEGSLESTATSSVTNTSTSST